MSSLRYWVGAFALLGVAQVAWSNPIEILKPDWALIEKLEAEAKKGNLENASPLAGSYRSHLSGGRTVDLVLKPCEGREGSYFALMILKNRNQSNVNLFLVDPAEPNVDAKIFGLVPLVVAKEDGAVGIVNDQPSSVLNVGVKKNGRPTLTFTDNPNSTNTDGVIRGPINFDNSEKSNIEWIGYRSANYGTQVGKDWVKVASTLSERAQNSREASSLFTIPGDLNGNFLVREVWPQIFTFRAFTLTNSGREFGEIPQKYGVFIVEKSKHLLFFTEKKVSLLLVDPNQSSSVRVLQK